MLRLRHSLLAYRARVMFDLLKWLFVESYYYQMMDATENIKNRLIKLRLIHLIHW